MNANERQIDGTHYATGGVQHWDYVIQVLNGRYLEGNITKYVARCYKKNGLLDVQKALHYCDKLLETYDAGLAHPPKQLNTAGVVVMNAFRDDAELDYWQARVILGAASWRTRSDLEILRSCVLRVVDTIHAAEPDRRYIDPDADS